MCFQILDCRFRETIESMDKQLIIDTLTRIGGNISAATVLTGFNRQSLHFKIKKYGIKKSEIIVNLKADVVFQ
ncbi:MAG: hypothetical protein AVO34_08685 [Firmicutes bacterium ML8_F2]|nr:MAG: hypothetical protein AVO34_08685 [Firmicutes bacterium ML8_F2]